MAFCFQPLPAWVLRKEPCKERAAGLMARRYNRIDKARRSMPQANDVKVEDARRLLVERLAISPYFNRSARLRDLLIYLTGRVLEDESAEVHEQEVGHKVFGRPCDYDTAADNIVR